MTASTGAAPLPSLARAPLLPGLPFLGSLLDMRRDFLGTFARAAALGDVVRLEFPGKVAHLLVHPEHVKHVLVDHHRNYGKQTRGYHMLRQVLGQGLVTSEGDFWRRQRRIAQPAFHHARIAGFGEIMVRATLEMLERWDERVRRDEVLDVDAEMMALTLRIVGQCLMSADLSDESDDVGRAVAIMLRQTVERITRPLSPPLFVPTPRNRAFTSARARLDALVFAIIEARRKSQGEHRDLLAMFMEARDEETGEGMSDRQLRDEVMTMVLAGHETTANALTWTFFLLSQHPEAGAELARELQRVLGGRPPTIGDLEALPYTEAVVKESMRLYPPVWMMARSVMERDEVGGVMLPKGSMVFLSPWVTQRDRRFWSSPERFEPERFLRPEIEDVPKYAYFPFAGGPRVCIGNGFAMMEAKLLVATILQRHRLTLEPGHPVEPEPTITLRPRHGMRMRASFA